MSDKKYFNYNEFLICSFSAVKDIKTYEMVLNTFVNSITFSAAGTPSVNYHLKFTNKALYIQNLNQSTAGNQTQTINNYKFLLSEIESIKIFEENSKNIILIKTHNKTFKLIINPKSNINEIKKSLSENNILK